MSIMNIDQCTVTLTRKCNLRCNFCYAKKTEYLETAILKYDNLRRIVDFCNDAQIKYMVFTGGEPTLYPQLIEILQYIKNKKSNIIPTIATNGIRLESEQYCKQLLENGIGYIDISLKGKDSKECCEIVGRDCYHQQLKAIHNLSLYPIDFTCSIVLTSYNIYSLCETVKNAHEYGAKQFSFTFVIDNELSKLRDKEYLKMHNPYALIDAFLSQIDQLNSITRDWWIEYSFPMCVYTDKQIELLKGKLASPCQIHLENGITFDTEMNLIPCNMHFEDPLGQLGVDFSSYDEFEEYAQNPTSTYRTTIERLKRYPSEKCISCKYLQKCYGGCPVTWKNYSFETLKESFEK